MVVSEIMERLSPNIAPQDRRTDTQSHRDPVFSLIPVGNRRECHDSTDRRAHGSRDKAPDHEHADHCYAPGKMDKPKLDRCICTAAAFTDEENAPAKMKTKHMIIMFSSPAPAGHGVELLLK